MLRTLARHVSITSQETGVAQTVGGFAYPTQRKEILLDCRTGGRSAPPQVADPPHARLARRGALPRLRAYEAHGGGVRLRGYKPRVGVPNLEADGKRRALPLRVGDPLCRGGGGRPAPADVLYNRGRGS